MDFLKKERWLCGLSIIEWLFILACLTFYILWCIPQPLGYGPDEGMRYDLPNYIFRYGELPDGYDTEIRSKAWGYSYAFYPCFLGPIISACLMKVTSYFTNNADMLLMMARLTSAFSGAGTVLFVLMTSKRVFHKAGRYIMPVLMAMIPQFVFLSSYVNNDALCVFGSAVMVFAWVRGIQEIWDYKTGLILAVGIVITALSYYNAYGWILCSIIMFGSSIIIKARDRQAVSRLMKTGIFISCVVLLCISYFFIRNALLYEGDFLGLEALAQSSAKYGVDELKPVNRMTGHNMKISVWSMIFNYDYRIRGSWIGQTYESFIGKFAALNVQPPDFVYLLYTIIFGAGFIGVLLMLLRRHILEKYKIERSEFIFNFCMLLCIIIPFALSVYYSYYIDFQAQGRYCYPMVVGLVYFVSRGLNELFCLISLPKLRTAVCYVFCGIVISTTIYIYRFTYLPS